MAQGYVLYEDKIAAILLTIVSDEPNPHETWFILFSQGPRAEALEQINAGSAKNQLWLRKKNRKAFYTPVSCENFRAGVDSLLQVSTAPTFNNVLHNSTKQSVNLR